MKKFSKIVENVGFKHFKVSSELFLLVEAETSGEAGYVSDSILGGIEEQVDFKINDISEVSDMEFKKLTESMSSKTEEWVDKNSKLSKTFKLEDFRSSIKFINAIAELANATNHHPEINNIYDKVTINLSTHDAGNKVTDKDKRMAQKIDALWKQI